MLHGVQTYSSWCPKRHRWRSHESDTGAVISASLGPVEVNTPVHRMIHLALNVDLFRLRPVTCSEDYPSLSTRVSTWKKDTNSRLRRRASDIPTFCTSLLVYMIPSVYNRSSNIPKIYHNHHEIINKILIYQIVVNTSKSKLSVYRGTKLNTEKGPPYLELP